MTSGQSLLYTIVNVAAANYTNYTKKPNIKRETIDSLAFMQPGEIGIKIADLDGESIQDHQAKTLGKYYRAAMSISEKTPTLRDNLLADIESLFEGNPLEVESVEYESDFKTYYRIILIIRIVN